MLGPVFARFIEKSPVSVMVRGMLERALNGETLDAWYDEVSDKQYTRTLLFSTLYDLLSQVVFKIKPSVHAAYQAQEEEVGVSVVAVYDKLKGTEVQRGMLIAIPPEAWQIFSDFTISQTVAVLQDLARHVRLRAFRKHPRGPKKPRPKRPWNLRQPPVSTAKLLKQRRLVPSAP